MFESRSDENCFPLEINNQEKYVLSSTAMKTGVFFKSLKSICLRGSLFLVDLTEMIVTTFDHYYSNVFQGFFWRQKTGQFCCVWQSEKDPSFLSDTTNIPFISTFREFQSLENNPQRVIKGPIVPNNGRFINTLLLKETKAPRLFSNCFYFFLSFVVDLLEANYSIIPP